VRGRPLARGRFRLIFFPGPEALFFFRLTRRRLFPEPGVVFPPSATPGTPLFFPPPRRSGRLFPSFACRHTVAEAPSPVRARRFLLRKAAAGTHFFFQLDAGCPSPALRRNSDVWSFPRSTRRFFIFFSPRERFFFCPDADQRFSSSYRRALVFFFSLQCVRAVSSPFTAPGERAAPFSFLPSGPS